MYLKAVSGRAHHYKPHACLNKPKGLVSVKSTGACYRSKHLGQSPKVPLEMLTLSLSCEWFDGEAEANRLSESSSPRVNGCDMYPGPSEKDRGGTSLALPEAFLN